MDLRLREVTWVRLLSLLLWTILMMLKRGISQLIELVERRAFEEEGQAVREGDQESLSGEATLLPPLSDELVLSRVWPLLHERVNISLLWRLRRVNRAWREKVGNTLEWAALEFVRIDAPGFQRLLESCGERRPSLRERVESELGSFTVLLAESLSKLSSQVEMTQSCAVDTTSTGDSEEMGLIRLRSEGGVLARRCICPCREIGCPGFDSDQIEESNWSEEEGSDAYSSTSGSSMRVYHPLHSLNVR